MARFRSCVALFALSLSAISLTTGCGSADQSEPESPSAEAQPADSAANRPSPTDVVSQFLDEVRRGGEDSRAQSLLTQQAQSVLERIGHTVQPIGSPDAQFNVTRAEPVPGEPNAALVHSLWREPTGDGSLQDFQVVWAVEQELGNWRISGLAIEVDPNQDPQIVDFEDSTLMSQLLSSDEPAPSSSVSTTQSPAQNQPAQNRPAQSGPAQSRAQSPAEGSISR